LDGDDRANQAVKNHTFPIITIEGEKYGCTLQGEYTKRIVASATP
jgi:hypothetical protein